MKIYNKDDLKKNFFTKRLPEIKIFYAILIVLSATFFISYIDYITGTRISLSVFYLIPVALALFLSGRTFGILTSILCSVIWLLQEDTEVFKPSDIYFTIWDLSIKIIFFLLFTLLIDTLLKALNRIKMLSFHDPLTKAANRRYFEEFSNNLIKRAFRDIVPLTLIYFDCDNFKELNDTFGHHAGDEALKKISNIVINNIRPDDIFARMGGDEFAMIIYGLSYENANNVIKRITDEINIEMGKNKWSITLSIGAVTYHIFNLTVDEMVKEADSLSYEVKKSGKNNIKHIEKKIV